MNEELQKALGELLGKANDGVDAAGNFLAAELPEVIQQLLTWHIFTSCVWGALFLIALAVCIVGVIVSFRSKDPCGELIVLLAIGSIGSLMVAYSHFSTALQIWIAPKVWLLEYAAKLVS